MRHGQREMNRQMNISLGLQCFRERISSSVVERCGGGGIQETKSWLVGPPVFNILNAMNRRLLKAYTTVY